jgi:hypothetical protein
MRFQRQSEFWKLRWFKPKLQTFQGSGEESRWAAKINIAEPSTLC